MKILIILMILIGISKIFGYVAISDLIHRKKSNDRLALKYGKVFGVGLLLTSISTIALTGMLSDTGLLIFFLGIVTMLFAQMKYGIGLWGGGFKKVLKSFKINIYLFIGMCICLGALLLYLYEFHGISFLLFNIDTPVLLYVVFVLIFVCITNFIAFRYAHSETFGDFKLTVVSAVLCFAFGMGTFYWAFSNPSEYDVRCSPDEERCIVICSGHVFIKENTEYYEWINPLFVKKLKRIGYEEKAMDDNGDRIEWRGDTVAISDGAGKVIYELS